MNYNSDRPQQKLYRSRSGKIMGVCKGLAQYFCMEVKWVRLAAIIALFATGFWPAVAIYFIAAYYIKPEPILQLETEQEEEFYNSYTASRSMALRRLKRNFDQLDRRIQRIESAVTTKEFSWEQRLNS